MPLNKYLIKGFDFKTLFSQAADDLIYSDPVSVGEWQSQAIDTPMREILNFAFSMPIPESAESLAEMTGAHLPWAEDHFQERVSGKPMNPAPSEAWWPFAKKTAGGTNRDHKSEGEAFSHTYPERIWPKRANPQYNQMLPNMGLRFELGDLNDVVNLMRKSPFTRQAYLPIWFPEDTGGAQGRRVPCTLGYHFMVRGYKLTVTYFMRSTDLLRHFQDDIYMAARLGQWMGDKLAESNTVLINEAELIFHTANLHIFEPDVDMLKWKRSQGQVW